MVVVPAFFMAVNLLKKIVIIYLFLDPVIMKGRNKMKKETNVTLVTVSIFIATFMTAIEGTIVTTAMPTIEWKS